MANVAIDFVDLTDFAAFAGAVILMPEGLKKFALIPGLIDVGFGRTGASKALLRTFETTSASRLPLSLSLSICTYISLSIPSSLLTANLPNGTF